MVEIGGVANPDGKSISQGAAKLRFNVDDLELALQHLRQKGIDAKIEKFDWGSTINIFDPDGNRIEITDETRFAKQLL